MVKKVESKAKKAKKQESEEARVFESHAEYDPA